MKSFWNFKTYLLKKVLIKNNSYKVYTSKTKLLVTFITK